MSVTHPTGLSRRVNRRIVASTLLLSGCAFGIFLILNILQPGRCGGIESVIYGASLFTCSLCSHLYTKRCYWFPTSLLRHLDHAAIFLLIAGTYTPFAARTISGPFGVPLIYWVWAVSVVGIILRLLIRKGFDRLFVGLYLLQGWLFLTAIPDIVHQISVFSMIFLGLGAVAYSVGAAIFARDIGRWTDPVWHSFVLSAVVLHFVAVLELVLRSCHHF
jgi:hemolysin III